MGKTNATGYLYRPESNVWSVSRRKKVRNTTDLEQIRSLHQSTRDFAHLVELRNRLPAIAPVNLVYRIPASTNICFSVHAAFVFHA